MRGRLITAAQCRGARAMLSLSQSELADIAGLSRPSIAGFESGWRMPRPENRERIRAALEGCGVEFLSSTGMRLKRQKPKQARKGDAV